MTITVRFRHALERITVNVHVTLTGGFTALLGPSGAGKTTVLNVIAGLLTPDDGLVKMDEDVLTDTSAGINRPSHERHIGYVFQDSRLFPHLTVRQNLAFGRWFSRQRSHVAIDEVVSLLDLAPLLPRHPAKLSGGEIRRVALGRALLSAPRLLLLDEPLGSLEVSKRQEILPYLDRLIAELSLPMIYVTHDWREIETRAATVVRMEEGKVVG